METIDLVKNAEMVAGILKTLSHPGRLLILCNLLEQKKNVNEISHSCDLSQSHTSQYLNQLSRQGLLEKEKTGKEVFYQIKDEKLKTLMESLYSIYCSGETHDNN